jgi:hypothetical protein
MYDGSAKRPTKIFSLKLEHMKYPDITRVFSGLGFHKVFCGPEQQSALTTDVKQGESS